MTGTLPRSSHALTHLIRPMLFDETEAEQDLVTFEDTRFAGELLSWQNVTSKRTGAFGLS